jgi:hypothetical protein
LTATAALVCRGRVYLGSDASSTVDETVFRQHTPKVFPVPTGPAGAGSGPKCIAGIAGDTSWEDAWHAARPRALRDTDIDAWIRGELWDAVMRGFTPNEHVAAETIKDSCALIGCGSRLYYCDATARPWRLLDPYAAIGVACDLLLGALGSVAAPARMRALGLNPREAMLEALALAGRHSDGVREPFSVLST